MSFLYLGSGEKNLSLLKMLVNEMDLQEPYLFSAILLRFATKWLVKWQTNLQFCKSDVVFAFSCIFYPPITRKRLKRCNVLDQEWQAICLPYQDRGAKCLSQRHK